MMGFRPEARRGFVRRSVGLRLTGTVRRVGLRRLAAMWNLPEA
jgi:hypothetical protein